MKVIALRHVLMALQFQPKKDVAGQTSGVSLALDAMLLVTLLNQQRQICKLLNEIGQTFQSNKCQNSKYFKKKLQHVTRKIYDTRRIHFYIFKLFIPIFSSFQFIHKPSKWIKNPLAPGSLFVCRTFEETFTPQKCNSNQYASNKQL